MRIKTIAMVATAVVVSTLVAGASASAAPEAVTGSTRTIANTPTGVSLTPIDDRTYRVTGKPRCGLFETTCQIHVGNVGGDYHWDGGTSTATFAGWRYGETRTPQFWTYACLIGCKNSAKVSGSPVTRPYPQRAITAQVASKDDAGRTARITGTASGKASIRLNGRQVATASDAGTGTWETLVTGLRVGQNTLAFQQYVGGQYRDQTSVTVTIAEPTKPGRVTGNDGTASLQRGGTTTVTASYTAQSAFTTPTGTLRFTAPEGTTFATGQDHQRGQYLDGSTWREFGGDSLVDGARSADGRTYSFTLGNRNWDVAAGQRFRFAMRVQTPADITTTTSALRGALVGSVTAGSFDTTATVTTTVVGSALTATATDIDAERGTATLHGTAPEDVTEIEVTWERDGADVTRSVAPSAPGVWSFDLSGLVIGSNPVHVVARAGSTELASTDVDVRLTVATLTAAVTFPDDVTKPAVVAGRGQPGAQVEVRDGGRVLASTTVGADGAWSVSVAAPGRGGAVAARVVQRLRGQDTDAVPLDIDYGVAVRITSPGDGFPVSPIWPTVRIAGVAEPGAVVRVGERGGPVDGVGRVEVGADGRWSVTTPPLGSGEHVIVATATSKGANTTSSSVRLVAGD
jgi:hypothetical protein